MVFAPDIFSIIMSLDSLANNFFPHKEHFNIIFALVVPPLSYKYQDFHFDHSIAELLYTDTIFSILKYSQ